MKRLGWILLALACMAIAWIAGRSHSPKNEPYSTLEFLGYRVVRIYDVGDLFAQANDEPEEPAIVSARNVGPPPPPRRGGGSGGGIFTTRERRRLDELTAMIAAIDQPSWQQGRASIFVFARRLVVVQSPENQELIVQLLQELRAAPLRHVRVEAVWASIKPEDLARIDLPGAGAAKNTIFDADSLAKMPGAILWRGESTCLNGNPAQITCGQARTILAKVEAEFAENIAGFSGKTQQLFDGAMLQVTPSLNGDGSTVLLDVHSEVTRFGALSPSAIEIPAAQTAAHPSSQTVKLDRLNLGVQSISTSVRGPTGAMILIGSTTDPDAQADDPRRLYLFIKAAKTN